MLATVETLPPDPLADFDYEAAHREGSTLSETIDLTGTPLVQLPALDRDTLPSGTANLLPSDRAAWKKNKPKKTEITSWNMIAHALTRRRISASVAKFDDAFAVTFGLVWMDDLFAEGGTDPRFTDQVELFMAA